MNLKRVLTDDEVVQLARLSDTGAGHAVIKVLSAEIERVRADVERDPTVADGKNDFRYRIGMIEGLKLAGKAAEAARLMVEHSEGGRS